MEDQSIRLQAGTSYLTSHHPFIAVPLLRLELEEGNPVTSTAATDGRMLAYNPEWIATLNTDQVIFVLAHEALHVAHLHHTRMGDRDHDAWNSAADYVVNAVLEEAGLVMFPGALYNPLFSGWSTEEVYDYLMDQAAQKAAAEQGKGNDSASPEDYIPKGPGGEVLQMKGEDGEELSPFEIAKEEMEVQVSAHQGERAQAMMGMGSSGASGLAPARRVVTAVSPGFDAREALLEYVQQCIGRECHDWSRPNRRYAPSGIYLPSIRTGRGLSDILLFIDTSGSIKERHLRFMGGVCEDVLAAYPEATVLAVYVDEEVRDHEEYGAHDRPIQLSKASGGLGTLYQPAFTWAELFLEKPPAVAIYLTDLAPSDRPADPGYPVVWLSIDRRRPDPPFGKRINLNLPAY